MKRLFVLGILLFSASSLAAQQTKASSPSLSNADTISKAMSAGPPDIANDAAIVEPTAGGQMKELRPGQERLGLHGATDAYVPR